MNEQVMTQTHSQQHIQEERAGKKWLQHAELIAALVSGVLILAAWFFYRNKRPVRHFVYPCLPDRGICKSERGN